METKEEKIKAVLSFNKLIWKQIWKMEWGIYNNYANEQIKKIDNLYSLIK